MENKFKMLLYRWGTRLTLSLHLQMRTSCLLRNIILFNSLEFQPIYRKSIKQLIWDKDRSSPHKKPESGKKSGTNTGTFWQRHFSRLHHEARGGTQRQGHRWRHTPRAMTSRKRSDGRRICRFLMTLVEQYLLWTDEIFFSSQVMCAQMCYIGSL